MSRVVLPTNRAREPNLLFLFCFPILSVLGGHSPFISVGILLLISFLFSSKLLRVIPLCGLHRIHLGGLGMDHDSLRTRTSI